MISGFGRLKMDSNSLSYHLTRRNFLASTAAVAVTAAIVPTRAQESKTLEIWMAGSQDRQGAWLSGVADRFQQENPGVTVRYTILDWGGASQKFASAAAAGSLPDVFFVYSSDMPTYAHAGALKPLEGLVDNTNIIDAGLKIGTWDGQWYGMPSGLDAPVYVFRKDFVKEAGLDPDAPPSNWDELATWSRELTARDGSGSLQRAGLWLATGHPWVTFNQFMAMLYANGGTLFSSDGMTSALTSDAAIETVSFLARLIRDDKVVEPGLVQAENRDFAEGRIATLISPIAVRGWAENYPDLNNPETVGFAPMPAGPNGAAGGIVTGGGVFLMSAKTPEPELAAKLIAAVGLDPQNVAGLIAGDAAPPPLKSSLMGDYLQQYPLAAEYHRLIEEYPRFYPKHPSFGAMYAPFNRALDNIYLTGADPKAEFEAAAREIDAIIEKSGVPVEESQG